MKKTFIYTSLTFITGLVAGAAAMLLAYPFLFPPAEVNEQIMDAGNKQIILTGTFIHPNPSDPVHWGKGDIAVYREQDSEELFLENNFEVGPGPDYHVYLSTGSAITSNDDFANAHNTELGKLKSFRGSQIYNINTAIDMNSIKSVVVWCKAFGQLITSAELN